MHENKLAYGNYLVDEITLKNMKVEFVFIAHYLSHIYYRLAMCDGKVQFP